MDVFDVELLSEKNVYIINWSVKQPSSQLEKLCFYDALELRYAGRKMHVIHEDVGEDENGKCLHTQWESHPLSWKHIKVKMSFSWPTGLCNGYADCTHFEMFKINDGG